jgi:hypothetical protein
MLDSIRLGIATRDSSPTGSVPTYFGLVAAQYRKTVVWVQIVIGVITIAALFQTHRLIAALAFFATMQVGAVFGALWAARLRSRIESARASHFRA